MSVDIMVIGAHPDDVEIGMGGTIAAFTKAEKKVVLVDLSDGEPTPFGTHAIRMEEAANAANILGVDKRITLDMVNREIMDTVENRKKLASVMREFKPEILFIPYWDDGHPDHVEAAKLCSAARFYSKFVKSDMPFEPHFPKKIYHYLTLHTRLQVTPSFIYNISHTIDTKVEALNSYKSQFIKNKKTSSAFESVRTENAYWGKQIRKGYGEPFVCKENIEISSPDTLLDA